MKLEKLINITLLLFLLVGFLTVAACTDSNGETTRPDSTTAEESAGSGIMSVVQSVFPADDFEVPKGSDLVVRLNETVSTDSNHTGDEFTASLAQDLKQGDRLLAPAGTEVKGTLTKVEQSGRVKGRAEMRLRLKKLVLEGEQYDLDTHSLTIRASDSKDKDAAVIAGSAAIGAVIGAITGGGKGAAIGATVGGGAGTGYVLTTKGKEVTLPSETRVSFTLTEALELPEYHG